MKYTVLVSRNKMSEAFPDGIIKLPKIRSLMTCCW